RGIALTIRAGTGFWPVIKLNPEDVKSPALLRTTGHLVLEGLDLQRMMNVPQKGGEHRWQVVLDCSDAPFYATNCRFLSEGIATCINSQSPVGELRNCEIAGDGVLWQAPRPGSRFVIGNCLHIGSEIVVPFWAPDARDSCSLQLT